MLALSSAVGWQACALAIPSTGPYEPDPPAPLCRALRPRRARCLGQSAGEHCLCSEHDGRWVKHEAIPFRSLPRVWESNGPARGGRTLEGGIAPRNTPPPVDRMSAEIVKMAEQGRLLWLEVGQNGKLTEASKQAADEVFLKLGGKVFFKGVEPMRARSKATRRGWGELVSELVAFARKAKGLADLWRGEHAVQTLAAEIRRISGFGGKGFRISGVAMISGYTAVGGHGWPRSDTSGLPPQDEGDRARRVVEGWTTWLRRSRPRRPWALIVGLSSPSHRSHRHPLGPEAGWRSGPPSPGSRGSEQKRVSRNRE